MSVLASWLLGVALAGEFRSAFPVDDPRPPPDLSGVFDRPPADHWQVPIPGQRSTAAAQTERARPVIAGGEILLGSATGSGLFAVDRASGGLLRTYPAAASVDAAPLVVGEFVFFADSGGQVWSYTRGGEERWSYDTASPVLTGPTLQGGTLYVVTVDDLVVALDADTGAMRWRYQHRGDVGRKVDLALYAAPRAVVHDDLLLVGFSDGTLTALELGTGDAAWQARVGEGRYPDLVGDPVVGDGLVFVSGFEEPLVALDLVSRQPVWTLPHGAAAAPTLVNTDAGPLLVQPGTDGRLRAVEARTGNERWTWESGADGALTEAVATDAGLFVGSSVGTLWLVDPDTGRTSWTYRRAWLLEGLSAPPTVEGRQLVFVTNGGRLTSLVVPRRDPDAPEPAPTPWTPHRKRR